MEKIIDRSDLIVIESRVISRSFLIDWTLSVLLDVVHVYYYALKSGW